MVIPMNYGDNLKKLRIEKNLTQEEIAKILNIAKQTYNHYELQENILPIKHLNTISNFYNVSIDYILGLTDTKNYPNSKKEINNIEAGNRLKEFRKENKLTQVKLASILNTTFSSIAFNEKGRNLIATPFLYTICKNYSISADYLLGKIDNPKYLK